MTDRNRMFAMRAIAGVVGGGTAYVVGYFVNPTTAVISGVTTGFLMVVSVSLLDRKVKCGRPPAESESR